MIFTNKLKALIKIICRARQSELWMDLVHQNRKNKVLFYLDIRKTSMYCNQFVFVYAYLHLIPVLCLLNELHKYNHDFDFVLIIFTFLIIENYPANN